MLRLFAILTVMLWFAVGIAELVALAPPAVDYAPKYTSAEKSDSKCDEERYSSPVRAFFCYAGSVFHTYSEDISAASTVVIAVFTVILGCFTISLSRSTKTSADAAKDAAIIAKRAAEAEISLHRPRLFIGTTALTEDDVETRTSGGATIVNKIPVCDYSIENYGSSPAIMIRQCVDLRCLSELPIVPTYFHDVPSRRVYYEKSKSDIFRASIPQVDFPGIRDTGKHLFLVVKFEYNDIFGGKITTGYCYRFDETSIRLIEAGDSAYNYDRREIPET